ncbi:hypothetical protein FQR65_LT10411 [Abscondita terminalis]|nr:hypothetical protein FQR65_LT10411 [Abscondita terminalis]
MEWNRDTKLHPHLPSPIDYGWRQQIPPIMCDLPCAPEDIPNAIKCLVESTFGKGRCKYTSHMPRLLCTEMCACGGDEEHCDNLPLDDSSDNDKPCGTIDRTSLGNPPSALYAQSDKTSQVNIVNYLLNPMF